MYLSELKKLKSLYSMLLLETEYVIIRYIEEVNCLNIRWLMKPDDAAFVRAHLATLQFSLDRHAVKYYCTDLTLVGSLAREQEYWLNQEFYEKSYNILQDDFFVAVVFSEEHFKAVVTNYVVPSATPTHAFVHFNYFTDQGEALHWLGSIKKGQDTALIQAVS